MIKLYRVNGVYYVDETRAAQAFRQLASGTYAEVVVNPFGTQITPMELARQFNAGNTWIVGVTVQREITK